jgi:aldehyde:ferredoxin oxidoreductase
MAGHGIFDIEADLALTSQCNQLGIGILAGTNAVHRLLEEGIITEKDIGYDVPRGDADALSRLMDDIVYRRTPFADALADGQDGLKRLPPEAADVHGDWRSAGSGGARSFAFAEMVNILPGYTKTNRPGIDVLGLPSKFLEELYGGGPVSSSYAEYEGKGRMVWWHERNYAMGDLLGICRFQTVFNSPHMPKEEEYIEMIRLTTGLDFTVDELRDIAERTCSIEKLTIVEHQPRGGERESYKFAGERVKPLKGGVLKVTALDPAKFEEFLDQYYELHGWDRNGVPTKATIKRLGVAKAKGL